MDLDCISASGWEMERPTNSKKMARGEFEMPKMVT